ncbi:MAG: tetratricopeptide repeat protein [Chloroflexi bacterium]|nr:tetratricopeptide repeat protein [Chloroflexota bacterium]
MLTEIDKLLSESNLREDQGDLDVALQKAQQALELARRNHDSQIIAGALVQVAEIQTLLGSYTEAFENASEVNRLSPDTHKDVTALITQGICAAETESLEKAEELFHRAADISRRIHFDLGLARALHNLAQKVYLTRGQFDLALAIMEESAQLNSKSCASNWGLPFLQAFINEITGNRRRTRRALDEMLPMVQPGSLIAGGYFFLWARLSLDEDEMEKADEYLHLAFNIANTTGAPDLNIWVRLETSRYYRMLGNAPTARIWADDALRFSRRTGYQYITGQALIERGQATWEAGDAGSAEADLLEAIQILSKQGNAYDQARAAFLLSALYANQEHSEKEDMWLDAANQIIRGGYAFILERERALAFPLVAQNLRSRRRDVRTASETLLKHLANVAPLPLRVTGLGYFRVWQARRPIPDQVWQRRKAGELFRFLLLQPYRTAHREAILDVLWQDYDPASAQDMFHQATSVLRHILEPDLPEKFPSRYLVVESERVLLQLPPGSLVDFEQFEMQVPQAIRSQKVDELKRLLSLYTGDLFPQDVYAEWTAAPRERLAQLYLRGLLALAEANLNAGQPHAALECCQTIVKRDPWNEDAVLLGMRACLALRDIPRAMRLYQELEHTLQEDLGILPRTDLRDLVKQLRQ